MNVRQFNIINQIQNEVLRTFFLYRLLDEDSDSYPTGVPYVFGDFERSYKNDIINITLDIMEITHEDLARLLTFIDENDIDDLYRHMSEAVGYLDKEIFYPLLDTDCLGSFLMRFKGRVKFHNSGDIKDYDWNINLFSFFEEVLFHLIDGA